MKDSMIQLMAAQEHDQAIERLPVELVGYREANQIYIYIYTPAAAATVGSVANTHTAHLFKYILAPDILTFERFDT